MGTYISTNVSFWVVEMDFLASTNHKIFFCLEERYFFKEFFVAAIREGFSLYWKLPTWEFFPAIQNRHWYEWKPFLKDRHYRLVEAHFSVQKKKCCFLLRTLFLTTGNWEAYSKLLSLLLATIFFNFLDMFANVNSFSSCGNQFSISTWNSILLFGNLFMLVEIHFLKK